MTDLITRLEEAADMKCPKCNARSGDDWEQCKGSCPLPGSPYFESQPQGQAMTDTVRVPREPLEPVVYGDERDELLALIRKRCPDFTAFPERPPEEMVKGGGTERKNDEAIERAFQDFRLAASPQGEGLTVDALAQEIRRVDGSNTLGAGALAEALMPFLASYRVTEGVKP